MLLAEQVFGFTITNSEGREVPVRDIAYHHIKEDLGRVPSLQDWLHALPAERWMMPSPTTLQHHDDAALSP